MQTITLDFETYYDPLYSLSKITTEEYIRHELFEVVGVSVKVNSGIPLWFSGPKSAVKTFLDQFPWDDAVAIAHNAPFDMAILNWHFGIRPKRIACTLSMARALHGTEVGGSLAAMAEFYGLGKKGTEVVTAINKGRLDFTPAELERYGQYCSNDVELCYGLFHAMLPKLPMDELKLIDLTTRMFTEPVLELDQTVLTNHLASVQAKKAVLMAAVQTDKADLMSNPKLAELLISLGVTPPTKVSARTGKETWAFGKTDEDFKALLDHPDPRVQAIIAARLGVKSTLEETRTERFLDISTRGTMPVPLRYYAAHTGRWGGDDKINLQNLPRKSPLKKAIKAPEGFTFIDCDSSQIEARTLAWLAGQDDLVEFFERNNEEIAAGVPKAEMKFDPYKIMASGIYVVPVDEVDDPQRFVGKTTILGCLAEGTLVATNRGWVPIEEVSISDRLWDGEEWVCHRGLVSKGTKETLSLCGLWLTPDHKVLCGTQWLEAQSVVHDAHILFQALDTGAASWSSLGMSVAREVESLRSSCNAGVDAPSTPLTWATSKTSAALGAPYVAGEKGTGNATGNTALCYQTPRTESGSSTASARQSRGATIPTTKLTPIMEGEGLLFVNSGGETVQSFYASSKQCPDGATPNMTWTELTTTGGTNRGTFGLCPELKTTPTEEKSACSRRNLMTYDIAYAGPRNRFTVATDKGPLIVHNCGYSMGPAKFQAQLLTFGVNLPLEECQRIIKVYRDAYPAIPALWRQAQDAVIAMSRGQGAEIGRDGIIKVVTGGVLLPNGMMLRYPNLREVVDENGKREFVYDQKRGRAVIPTRLYGGKLVENICQALARIVIGEQMLKVARKLRVVMTVHDAIGSLAPTAEAEQARAFVEQEMRVAPAWAVGLPLNCESKMGATYGG